MREKRSERAESNDIVSRIHQQMKTQVRTTSKRTLGERVSDRRAKSL